MLATDASAIYPNPMTRTINLNPYIAGNAGSVWIRFSWTSGFPTDTNPELGQLSDGLLMM